MKDRLQGPRPNIRNLIYTSTKSKVRADSPRPPRQRSSRNPRQRQSGVR